MNDIFKKALELIVGSAANHAEDLITIAADALSKKPTTKDIPYSFGTDQHPGFAKIVEEQGELLQEIGKIMMVGGAFAHWSGDLKKPLHDELADSAAAIEFYASQEENMSDEEFLAWQDRKNMKLARFQKWHDNGEELPA